MWLWSPCGRNEYQYRWRRSDAYTVTIQHQTYTNRIIKTFKSHKEKLWWIEIYHGLKNIKYKWRIHTGNMRADKNSNFYYQSFIYSAPRTTGSYCSTKPQLLHITAIISIPMICDWSVFKSVALSLTSLLYREFHNMTFIDAFKLFRCLRNLKPAILLQIHN